MRYDYKDVKNRKLELSVEELKDTLLATVSEGLVVVRERNMDIRHEDLSDVLPRYCELIARKIYEKKTLS